MTLGYGVWERLRPRALALLTNHTPAEVAAMLNVSTSTVIRWSRQ